ncbi:MAG: serine/threonine-protein kinase [Myxococcaceae bacterium]
MHRVFGPYRLIRRLAVGGMGEVFLAQPLDTSRASHRLVVKRILPHFAEDPDFAQMFLREARFAAQLVHKNLIHIEAVGQEDDAPYLAMEYVRGENLSTLLKAVRGRNRPIPLEAAARIAAEVAEGLAHAHAQNLVHRDVSPQNILIGFDGAVKLIDFGIAKAAHESQPTVTGVLKGKCAYMSPEQAAGDALETRSDVFSLGIVFWEMLTGKRLFKGNNDQMTVRLVMDCRVPPPSRLRSGLPSDVDAWVARVLAKNPNERPTAQAFAEALRAWVPRQSVAALAPHLALLRELFPERAARTAEDEERLASVDLSAPVQAVASLPGQSDPEENESTQTLLRGTGAWQPFSWRLLAGLIFLVVAATLLTVLG